MQINITDFVCNIFFLIKNDRAAYSYWDNIKTILFLFVLN